MLDISIFRYSKCEILRCKKKERKKKKEKKKKEKEEGNYATVP